jgi:hypothetical protein
LPGRHDRATLDAIATRIRAALEDAFNVFNNEVFISASMGWPACPKMRKPRAIAGLCRHRHVSRQGRARMPMFSLTHR